LMVLLDIFIEPVAIRYDFWSWAGGAPPLQNYVGWFLVSLPLLSLFALIQAGQRNKVALVLLALQFIFFITLNLSNS
ncbi:carotenoid biosynthesis protein, partial [bacterium]|nr:carotenoid biosynthesis protein [bacterium]